MDKTSFAQRMAICWEENDTRILGLNLYILGNGKKEWVLKNILPTSSSGSNSLDLRLQISEWPTNQEI